MNTQLASWAQLRHNTILYAKQSYTMGITCFYPDGYVEPYPEFYRAVGTLIKRLEEFSPQINKASLHGLNNISGKNSAIGRVWFYRGPF